MADPAAPRSGHSVAELERGLDALETHPAAAQGRPWRRVFLPVLALGVLVLAWQVAYWAEIRPRESLPSPGQVATAVGHAWTSGDLPAALALSLGRGLSGFAASVAIGIALGLLIAWLDTLRVALVPLLSGLQTLPSVAWVPAAVLLFGTNDATIYFIMITGAVPAVATGTVSGLRQVPPLYPRVGRVLGARGATLAWTVLLPAALPGFLAGLRLGWAFSWRALMAAELIAGSDALGEGVGQLLDDSRRAADSATVFALVLVILAVGIAVELALFAPLERRILRRRGLATP